MKKCESIFAMFALTCALFCSCADVPDSIDVNDNTETVEYFESISVQEGNLETIRNQLENDLKKQYKNIVIKNARVGNGSIMPSYDIKMGGNPKYDFMATIEYLFADKFDVSDTKLYSKYYKDDPIDPNYPATFEPSDYAGDGIRTPNSYDFDIDKFSPNIDDITQSVFSYSTGAVWGSEIGGNHTENYLFENCSLKKRYDLNYDEIDSDLSYKLEDGIEWNVNDAIAYVENFWNTYLSDSDPEKYEYNVKTLFVMTLGAEKYGYLFELERKNIDGNYYDVDCGYIQDDYAIENGNAFKISNMQLTWCTEKEIITRFIKDDSFCRKEQTSDGTKLLTLKGAADILSDSLASNINLAINSAELNYVLVCKGYPYFQMWEYPEYYKSICVKNCDFEIKPYWCFRTNKSTIINQSDCEIFFVDAVTGELDIMRY